MDYFHLIIAIILFLCGIVLAASTGILTFILSVLSLFFAIQELRRAIPKPKR